MTVIEMQFFESAIRFFRENSNQKVDWEERRFQAASVILSGMMSNDSTLLRGKAEKAVKMADFLIEYLKKEDSKVSK